MSEQPSVNTGRLMKGVRIWWRPALPLPPPGPDLPCHGQVEWGEFSTSSSVANSPGSKILERFLGPNLFLINDFSKTNSQQFHQSKEKRKDLKKNDIQLENVLHYVKIKRGFPPDFNMLEINISLEGV